MTADHTDDLYEQTSIFDAHPMLGKYLAHYTSNRFRLLLIGGVAYAAGVAVLQLLFAGVDDETAAIFLPVLFAGLALPISWYVMHLWNREVVLYEMGFSYREGSNQAFFVYENILSFMQSARRLALFGVLRYDRYRAALRTDQDEVMLLNNVYGNAGELIERLEKQITKARLPLVRQRLANEDRIAFHESLSLSATGYHVPDEDIAWNVFAGYKVAMGHLQLFSDTDKAHHIPLSELDNLLLLIALLREHQPKNAAE